MAFQHHAHGRPQVIQGRFPGGRPTIIQPKPASSQHQVPTYVQDAIHRGAPAFYRHVAQRKQNQQARTQAGAAQPHGRGAVTRLPEGFLFAPSIGQPLPPPVQRKMDAKFSPQSRALRQALILQGVDFNGARALVGTCHTDEVVEDTLRAFAAAVRAVKEAGYGAA